MDPDFEVEDALKIKMGCFLGIEGGECESLYYNNIVCYFWVILRNIMEESLRRHREKNKNSITALPPIQSAQRPLKEVLNTENAFKLCRVGVKKTKFINFDLKYTQDENALLSPQESIKIPLMVFNKNRFSPYREKSPKKQTTHLMLVSRVRQSESLPSISRHHYNLESSAKFKKPTISLFGEIPSTNIFVT